MMASKVNQSHARKDPRTPIPSTASYELPSEAHQTYISLTEISKQTTPTVPYLCLAELWYYY